MSSYPTDDSVPPVTPIFDETVSATAVRLDTGPVDSGSTATGEAADRGRQAASTVKDAAGTAKDTAKETAGQVGEQAQKVGDTAKDAGQRVGATAKDQAGMVASDAVGQAKELYGQATEQLSEQAGKQQKNAASALKTLSGDLSTMHQQDQNGGLAAELVQNVSQRAGRIADWLEDRDPAEVLDEVKQFAAGRPGLFIGLAAVSGIVAARAVKALTADAKPAPSRKAPASAPQETYSETPIRSARTDADSYGAGLTGTGAGLGSADRASGLGDFR